MPPRLAWNQVSVTGLIEGRRDASLPLLHMISRMTEVQERSALSPEVGTTRVEAFSDSVMAVIITIMAFELRPPVGAGLDAMRDQLPGLLVYILSFVFVGIYWNNHLTCSALPIGSVGRRCGQTCSSWSGYH